MPPQIPILAQSENKSKFLERLGISDQSDDGKRLYALMKVRFCFVHSLDFLAVMFKTDIVKKGRGRSWKSANEFESSITFAASDQRS